MSFYTKKRIKKSEDSSNNENYTYIPTLKTLNNGDAAFLKELQDQKIFSLIHFAQFYV